MSLGLPAARTPAGDGRRRGLALAASVILHLSALACIVLFPVQAPQPLPEPPPMVVVMITPPALVPAPARAPAVQPPAPIEPPPRAMAAKAPAPPPVVPVRPQPTDEPTPPVPLPAAPAPATPTPAAPLAATPVPDPPARPVAAATAGAGVAATAPAAAPARPAVIVPPSFDADYLHNPPPRYPPAAARLRESGRVLLSVAVSAAGLAERVEVVSSSGSPRLDQAARETVLRWRFVPARQGDRPVAATVTVPLVFRLDE